MNRFFLPLLSAALCLPSFAYGETFETEEAWGAAVAGEIISTDFGSLIGREASSDFRWIEKDGEGHAVFEWLSDSLMSFDTLQLDSAPFSQAGFVLPQTLPWGELSTQSETLLGFSAPLLLNGYNFITDYAVGGRDIELSLNPELGQLSGVSFRVSPGVISGIASETQVKFFDGDNLVESFSYVPSFDTIASATAYVGWTNNQNLNVTRIEISFFKEEFDEATGTLEEGEDALVIPYLTGLIADGELAFTQATDAPSSQELLDEILVDVGSIPAIGNRRDDRRITRAINRLNNATNPRYWQDEDTLSSQGAVFFRLIERAVRDLVNIRQPNTEVEQAIQDLDSLVRGIAETEIAKATADGGRQKFLSEAEYHQELGDLCAAAGHYQSAIRLRAWAWYFARIS